jgi:hypothetical protein
LEVGAEGEFKLDLRQNRDPGLGLLILSYQPVIEVQVDIL